MDVGGLNVDGGRSKAEGSKQRQNVVKELLPLYSDFDCIIQFSILTNMPR